jgi:hypothetical protein
VQAKNCNNSLPPLQQFKVIQSLPQRKEEVYTVPRLYIIKVMEPVCNITKTTWLNFKLPLLRELSFLDSRDTVFEGKSLSSNNPQS